MAEYCIKIPRQACLGLIEAEKGLPYHATVAEIPRQACLGLIEAMTASVSGSSGKAFRGKLASASLKLEDWLDQDDLWEVFRGKLASASLKLLGFLAVGVPRRIPRQACLGLIEARVCRAGLFAPSANSEASLPRPH